MKKIFHKVKDLFKNKKLMIIIGIILLILIIMFIIINHYRDYKSNKNTIEYNKIEKLVNDKDTLLIYYYNSKSSNKNNKKIKKYLDELGIRYYNYNDIYIDRLEYDKFTKLVKIDKNLLNMPALIYIKDGIMYGNIINIDNKDVVLKFIEDYDLYTVK